MLSEAQKQGQKPKLDKKTKWYQNKIKIACKKTGLPPQHPDTLKELENVMGNIFIRPWFLRENLTAKTVVDRYAK